MSPLQQGSPFLPAALAVGYTSPKWGCQCSAPREIRLFPRLPFGNHDVLIGAGKKARIRKKKKAQPKCSQILLNKNLNGCQPIC